MKMRGIRGKVERHMALIAIAEVVEHVGGPLIGLSQQHPVAVMLVHLLAGTFEDLVALRQVLAVGPFAFDEVGMASNRMPSTPMSSQNRMTSKTSRGGPADCRSSGRASREEEPAPVVRPLTRSQSSSTSRYQ